MRATASRLAEMAYSRKPSMVANCAIIKNINLRNVPLNQGGHTNIGVGAEEKRFAPA